MAWVATMLRVMDKIEVALGAITPTQYGKAYDELALHVDAVSLQRTTCCEMRENPSPAVTRIDCLIARPSGSLGQGRWTARNVR